VHPRRRYTCVNVCIYVCRDACMRVCMFACVFVCLKVCMHITQACVICMSLWRPGVQSSRWVCLRPHVEHACRSERSATDRLTAFVVAICGSGNLQSLPHTSQHAKHRIRLRLDGFAHKFLSYVYTYTYDLHTYIHACFSIDRYSVCV